MSPTSWRGLAARPATAARTFGLAAAFTALFGAPAAAQHPTQPLAPADTGAFVAADSTLLVVVPASASPARVLAAVGAVRGRRVAAVYTTDDGAAWRLGGALAGAVGGSLVPYDRAGAGDDAYAARLVRNAVMSNPGGAVLIVAPAALADPLYRQAAAASRVTVPPGGRAGGGPGAVLVLGIAPQTQSLVRARY